jgi:hypothetical protein
MKLTPSFKDRDFSPVLTPQVTFTIDRYNTRAIGGCDTATISATGGELELWQLLNMLRYGVEIQDELGNARWWGYVNEVVLEIGGVSIGASLDTMSNKIAVAYSYVAAGTSDVGMRKTTAWISDTDSTGEYGTKELLKSLSGATDAQANSMGTASLSSYKYPIPVMQFYGAAKAKTAKIYCRGWFNTLAWRYAEGDSGDVATTSQIETMITTYGEFITATTIEDASGINTSSYRDGDTTLLSEVQDLLQTGTTDGRRLLLDIDRNRRARVYIEPASTTINYYYLKTGKLSDAVGNPLMPGEVVAGVWCALKDIVPVVVDLTILGNPTPFFIEACEWDNQAKQLYITPRGQRDPWVLPAAFEWPED